MPQDPRPYGNKVAVAASKWTEWCETKCIVSVLVKSIVIIILNISGLQKNSIILALLHNIRSTFWTDHEGTLGCNKNGDNIWYRPSSHEGWCQTLNVPYLFYTIASKHLNENSQSPGKVFCSITTLKYVIDIFPTLNKIWRRISYFENDDTEVRNCIIEHHSL